jgi:gliding motility-associated-like protein
MVWSALIDVKEFDRQNRMNKYILLLCFVLCTALNDIRAQDAVHNYGPMQVHTTGSVGFHMNVINDGAFNQNLGLVGFYNDNTLTLSGTSNPVLYDTEIAVDNGFYIENTLGILNNTNLVSGTVFTPRSSYTTNLSFITDSFYTGESNTNMVDGYASILGKQAFTFPIGENGKLRPLTLTSEAINDYARSAYFDEDPNSPSILGTSFNTDEIENEFLSVSALEFWKLEGEVPSTVTLTWDDQSFVSLLGEFITDLKVVGWNVMRKQWENLGNSDVQGSSESGSVTSDTFIPNDYDIITIGGSNDLLETLNNIKLDNYYMTPNGDGINDRLVIEGIENSPNNTLQIFDRYGVLVYSKQNYIDDFDGISNRESVISKGSGLASGIYFYIIILNDLNQRHQGYLYLTSYEKN